MAEVKFAMWNCSGILPSSSAKEKMDFIKACTPKSIDVLVLIETHHKVLEEISSILATYTSVKPIHTGRTDGDPYAGIAVLTSNRVSLLQQTVLIPGRLLNFKVKNQRKVFNITALYGYTGGNASQTKMAEMTELLAAHHSRTDNNIILGDFNFVEDDLDRTNQKRSGKNHTDNILAKPWREFAEELGLLDPFRARNPSRRMYSYIHTMNNAKSRIDRVYLNEENCNDLLSYTHVPTIFNKTHKMVIFSLKEDIERGPGLWKMNTSILKDPLHRALVENTVNDVMSLGIDDPVERWLVFTETVAIDTRAYCAKKRQIEKAIKTLCERKIAALEQDPSLSQDITLHKEHEYYISKLNEWNRKQVEGHQTRIKTQPRLEPCEPNISFFADLEQKESKKKSITHLMNSEGKISHDTQGMEKIATDYYSSLFGEKKTNSSVSLKLLRNIKKQITPQQKAILDNIVTSEELEKAVYRLQKHKTPGPDGIPAEFYQEYWYLLSDLYLEFINAVKQTAFPKGKNTSITALFYKEKGDIYLLANYRPIALMNVDVKIITKLLSMRLNDVLPSIIHESQTAVMGRQIGNSVHLVRDIIDYANENNEGAALLFIDQEKAFDRVSHAFLFDALRAYGFGDNFVQWIQLLYSNAFTRININGFLTRPIPLKCGVRQGCPLSALLYVLIIEILALQLRANPNIVGFSIQGEKIISTHYADDAVIKITQNRCFKEVYKELHDYEQATGAKVNYDKTTGLWVGSWKNRTDNPFHEIEDMKKMKWTNRNVKYVGIYVGNENPALQTFNEIIPKMKRRLNFWKPLRLPPLAKARVIEIYLASKLFYALNFYPLPSIHEKDVTDAFLDYITFPKNGTIPQISRKEMEKLREDGGLKLINIKLKSQTPKVHWLIRLITEDTLKVQLALFNSLIGTQSGQLAGQDIIFAENSFVKRILRTDNEFYKEALDGITKLERGKHYTDIKMENVFYNPMITSTANEEVHEGTITPFRGNRELGWIKTYGDLLNAGESVQSQRLKAAIRRKIESIDYILPSEAENAIISRKGGKRYTFTPTHKEASQAIIYSELIIFQSRQHSFQLKWNDEGGLPGPINWNKVWESVHKQFYTEKVKSTIWEQIHLNFYTTYNYNKWHNVLQPCPLCNKIPDDIFHIVIDCKFTKTMWKRVEKTLKNIIRVRVSESEKAFGLQPRTKKEKNATILRNWITFSLRHQIMQEERKAFHIPNYHLRSMEKFFLQFNLRTQEELKMKKLQYDHRNLAHKFQEIVTINKAIASKNNEGYRWKDIM